MQCCLLFVALACVFAAENYDTAFTLPQKLIPEDARDWCMDTCTNATTDCNEHGICACKIDGVTTVGDACSNAGESLTHCKCDNGWSGANCDECKWGWEDDDQSNRCAKCADSFGPPGYCNRYCEDDMCQQGGMCKAGTGICECVGGFGGHYCTRCASPYQQWPDCGCNVTCGPGGACAPGGQECQCHPGFIGAECNQCAKAGEQFPLCGSLAVSKMGAASSSECEGGSVALPVILSILGTLLVMGGGAAAYTVWQNKQAGAGGSGAAKSSNWTDFEKDTTTAYSQL